MPRTLLEFNRAEEVSVDELTPQHIQNKAEERGLIFDERIYHSLASALSSGKHVILEGPPGTGKSTLAQLVAELCSPNQFVTETGSAAWSTYDTIGRYRVRPGGAGELQFVEGFFLRCFRQNRWLVLDELNRAEIDKAVGAMFTVLAGQDSETGLEVQDEVNPEVFRRVVISPEGRNRTDDERVENYVVPSAWRMVATMNEQDQHLLFTMSEAFKRRFAIINLPANDVTQTIDIVDQRIPELQSQPKDLIRLNHLAEALESIGRPLGPAIFLDCAKLLVKMREYETSESLFMAAEMLIRPHLTENQWEQFMEAMLEQERSSGD